MSLAQTSLNNTYFFFFGISSYSLQESVYTKVSKNDTVALSYELFLLISSIMQSAPVVK